MMSFNLLLSLAPSSALAAVASLARWNLREGRARELQFGHRLGHR